MLKIVTYPHPTLRYKSLPVVQINRRLREIVRQMFDLMYQARGVGLAANQVNLPLRLFVVNLAGNPHEGEETVYINPVLSRPKGKEEQEEGCLSLPGLYAPVWRPAQIHIVATDLLGQEFHQDLTGMAARVVQHETDHLDGVLFIDRLSVTASLSVAESLQQFQFDYEKMLHRGAVPPESEIMAGLRDWQQEFCHT